MFWPVYNLLFHLVYLLMLPKFLLRMRRRGGYRKDFGERLFRLSEEKQQQLSEARKLWVHAVSVGEFGVARSFMQEWRRRHPDTQFLVTVNTSTAHRIAEQHLGEGDVLLYPPLDSPLVIRSLLNTVELEGLVLVETEMWPNQLRMLQQRNIPVMLLNGRISDRSFRRLQKVPLFTRRIYPLVNLFCMQSEEDAERAKGLGAPAQRLQVMHSAKYDVAAADASEEEQRRRRLQDSGFWKAGELLLLGSSTWPGEERVLMEYLQQRRTQEGPAIRLVLVPRHFERREEVLAEARALGLDLAFWSEANTETLGQADVLMVDTTGELMHFTGIADRVFVGKSLFLPEGQNPLEAAAAGKWILCGAGMNNFRRVIQDLKEADAVQMAQDEESLVQALDLSLKAPDAAEAQGHRARELVDRNRGALARSADALEALLNQEG